MKSLAFAFVAISTFCSAAPCLSCDIEAFGQSPVKTCKPSDNGCVPTWLPPELSAIKAGLYTGNVGLSINDGMATWIGLNLENREFVRIDRYAGRRIGDAPAIPVPSANRYRNDVAERRWVDIVNRGTVTDQQFQSICDAASPLWQEPQNLYAIVTDSDTHLVLVRGDTYRKHGAAGGLRAGALKVSEALWDAAKTK